MSKELVERIDRMVRGQISSIEDDLARSRLQQRKNPNWVSGNGEHISEIVRKYEYELDQTRKCLPL
jgi:ABC-type phosphate transport system auxiliary subunit